MFSNSSLPREFREYKCHMDFFLFSFLPVKLKTRTNMNRSAREVSEKQNMTISVGIFFLHNLINFSCHSIY